MTAHSGRVGVVLLGGAHGSLAVARSLGRRGVPVTLFASSHSVAGFSRYVGTVVEWVGAAEPAPVERLVEESRHRGYHGWLLLPGDDFGVQLIAENHERLASQFALPVLDWTSLAPLNDKSRLSNLAARAGLDTPRVYQPMSNPADLDYPVVIKPSFTKGTNALTRAKAWRCDNASLFKIKQAEAARLVGANGFVVQQLIPGDGDVQYSYAAYWRNGQEQGHMTALRLRQYPLEFGVSPFVVQRDLPRAADEARKLLAAVGYDGLVEVEFKLDRRDDRLKLIDVNTRVWAWIGLADSCGLDFIGQSYAAATGEPLGPPRVGRKNRVAWRRHVPALLSLAQNVGRHQRPGLAGWQSVLAPALGGVFAADDPLPGLCELPLKIWERLRPSR